MESRILNLKDVRSYLKSAKSIKLKFQSIGIITILCVFGILVTNDSFDIFSYNADVLMRILMFLMLITGMSYLLFIDSENFKIGSLGLAMTDNINSQEMFLTPLKQNTITIKNEKKRCIKTNISELKLKPIFSIEKSLKTKNIIPVNYYEELKNLIERKEIKERIQLRSQNEKNIFVYAPVFDLFDNIIDGGINTLYGKSRRIFLSFVVKNFSKNGEPFGYENLRKRYIEWLNTKNSNSDNYLAINQTCNLFEYL